MPLSWDDNEEYSMKIYKITQPTIDSVFDFSDGNLLAAAYLENNAAIGDFIQDHVIFDKEIFNQDIFITLKTTQSVTRKCNYYLELETESLSDNAAAVSTLRDIRLNPQVGA